MNTEIHDEGTAWRYFHIMLNIEDDELDPYEYRLLGHYRRVCGVNNTPCVEGTRETAKRCKMSIGKVVETRKKLAEVGWIRLHEEKNRLVVTLVDKMPENVARYARRPEPPAPSTPPSAPAQPQSSSRRNGRASAKTSAPPPEPGDGWTENRSPGEQSGDKNVRVVNVTENRSPGEQKRSQDEHQRSCGEQKRSRGERPLYIEQHKQPKEQPEEQPAAVPDKPIEGRDQGVASTGSSEAAAAAAEKKNLPEVQETGNVPTGDAGQEAGRVFAAYEDNIGALTPFVAQVLGEAIDEYGAAWVKDAISEAVVHNVRKWKYIEAILKRRKQDGARAQVASKDDRYAKYVRGYEGIVRY